LGKESTSGFATTTPAFKNGGPKQADIRGGIWFVTTTLYLLLCRQKGDMGILSKTPQWQCSKKNGSIRGKKKTSFAIVTNKFRKFPTPLPSPSKFQLREPEKRSLARQSNGGKGKVDPGDIQKHSFIRPISLLKRRVGINSCT